MSEHNTILCRCPGTSAWAPSVNTALRSDLVLEVPSSARAQDRLRHEHSARILVSIVRKMSVHISTQKESYSGTVLRHQV